MSVLNVENFTKSYGEKVLFDAISFSVADRQRVGLIGVNGTGKSSLLRALAGLEPPDGGKVLHAKEYRIEYLAQSPEFEPGITVLEHIFRGDNPLMRTLRDYETALSELEGEPGNARKQEKLFAAQQRMDAQSAWEAEAQAKTVLGKLGIREYTSEVSALSGGQRKRVALASALLHPADLLLLDEPTNHIDNETVQWLEEELSRYRGSLLVVTHDRYFLDRVTNRIFELHRGKLYVYEGNYSVFLEKKAEREEQEAASEAKRQNLLRRELEWLRRGAKARTTKQKARIDRAEELRDRNAERPDEAVDFALAGGRLGKKVIELKGVTKRIGGRTLVKDFTHIVLPGERIGIVGPNGSGKTTLLNLIAGRLAPDEGTVETGSTVKLAFYNQENEELDGSLRVIEYIKEAAEVIHTADGEIITAAQMLERFLFPGPQQWTLVSRLSGGEKRRLYLLRTLMGEPNVLLLDEPTNDLDIQTLSVLEDYLDHFPGAVLSVSHDRYFLDRTVDRLFLFDGQGGIRTFEGNYSEYLEAAGREQLANPPSAVSSVPAGAAQGDSRSRSDKPRKLSYKDQKEWDEIEGRIAALEAKSAELKRQIEASGSDYDQVRDLYEEDRKTTEELDRAMERWAELSEQIELLSGS
jgi:ATP-binding cassette subfamily F protein uup